MSDIFKNYSNIDGIYYDKNKNHQVSFPADGYMQCFIVEDNSFWFKHRLDVINKYVSDTTISGSIIDVGGGNGFISKSLQDSNVDVILMEPGVDGVKNAQKRGVNKIICSVLEDENIDDNMIDNICLFDVIEHIENDKAFVEMVYRKLKIGGKLFVTVPSLKILWSDIDVDSGHYRRYSINEIENLLKESGFEVVQSNYFFSFLVIPMFFCDHCHIF